MSLANLILAIIILCVPIYLMVGRKGFAHYLMILFGGTIMQSLGLTMLLPHDQTLALVWYHGLAIIIDISLICFIIKEYLGISLLREKRTVIFIATSMLGVGAKAITLTQSDMAVWNLALTFNVTILILGFAYLTTQNFKSLFKTDGGLLLSILITALTYVAIFGFNGNKPLFYRLWGYAMLGQAVMWLIIGSKQLLNRRSPFFS